jgi:hypothetical protein
VLLLAEFLSDFSVILGLQACYPSISNHMDELRRFV